MFCRQCGAQIPQGARFCKSCGAPVPEQSQGSSDQAAQPSAKVVVKRKSKLPLVIGVVCVVLLVTGFLAIRALMKPKAASAPSGTQATENVQSMSDDSNASAQQEMTPAASSWVADAVKFENAAIKTTSYGRAYLTVDIHNTSDYYVPYVFFDGTVKAKLIDEYGEESVQEYEILDVLDNYLNPGIDATDYFISEFSFMPQETRTVTYLLSGEYYKQGDPVYGSYAGEQIAE